MSGPSAEGGHLTTEQVAWEQSTSTDELLDTHYGSLGMVALVRPSDLRWSVEEVPVERLSGGYEPHWYYDDPEEGPYMLALEAAIDRGEVPLPAFIECGGDFDHADGAHRTVVAIRRGQPTIRGYVAHCPGHSAASSEEVDRG